MASLTELYGLIDDCCNVFEPVWERHELAIGAKRRRRPSLLSRAELMCKTLNLIRQFEALV